jgi:hypothetical protein
MTVPAHDIRISLSVDGAEIESMKFDCERATVALARRPDGAVTVVFSRDDDGMPPDHLLRGGAGYPGAHTFVLKKVLATEPPEKAGKAWRLVRAVGWSAAPPGAELRSALMTSYAIQILQQRLLTGWQPRAGEIDRDVRQVDVLDWEWSFDGRSILSRTIDRRPQIHGDILYVDRHLTFALTSAVLLWLYDADESEKIRYLGD